MYKLVKKSSNSQTNHETNVTTVMSSNYVITKDGLQIGDVNIHQGSFSLNIGGMGRKIEEVEAILQSVFNGVLPQIDIIDEK